MSDSFTKLKAIWDKKLKNSGFRDIEYKDGSLERGAPNLSKQAPVQVEAIEAYYTMARHFILEYDFESELEKTIWCYHSEGLSYRDIAILLKKVKVKKLQKSRIGDTITRLEKEMKRRYLHE